MAGEQEPEDAARGDGEQENRIGLENRNQRTRRGGDGGRRGTGEQDWAGERERRTRRGETGNRRTGFAWRTGMEDAAEGDGEQENGIGLENGN